MDSTKYKTINYRGGIVRFRIPADWQEEYEQAGGGTFYAPGDDTGTLRLNITTFGAPGDRLLTAKDAQGFLQPFADKYGVEVRPLQPGIAMIRYDIASTDHGQSLKIRYWQVVQVVQSSHVRMSLFSYTLLAKQFEDWLAKAEMEILENEVTAAEFCDVMGQIGS